MKIRYQIESNQVIKPLGDVNVFNIFTSPNFPDCSRRVVYEDLNDKTEYFFSTDDIHAHDTVYCVNTLDNTVTVTFSGKYLISHGISHNS